MWQIVILILGCMVVVVEVVDLIKAIREKKASKQGIK